LRGLAKGIGIEVAEDLESQLRGKCGEEVDAYEVPDVGREKGELREAALSEDALKHKVPVLRWCSRKQGPYVGDTLLVTLGQRLKLLRGLSAWRESRDWLGRTHMLQLFH
jgi:hypothetical protein